MSEAAPASRTEADATYRKIFWRIMPFLMVIYVVSFIDRANVGVAKLQFTGELGFSEAVYGLGSGIFYLGYIMLEIPSNLYLERVGARKTLLRIMVLWGLACVALGFMSEAWHFYGLRFLLGAAEAGLFPGMLLYLTFWIPASRRAQFTAMFMASIAIAGMLGGPLGGWIMSHFGGMGGLSGWQWLFIIEGLPAVILGFVAYLYLDDGPAKARWLSDAEKQTVMRDLDQERASKKGASHESFLPVLKDPRFYMVAALAFAIMVSTGGMFLWVPTIIRQSGVESILHIGLLSSLPFAVGFVAQALVARHSDKTMERRWHAALPALVAAVGWALLPSVAKDTTLALVAVSIASAGTLAAMGPFWTLPTTLMSAGATAGGFALITTIAGLGNFLSPIFVGWLSDRTGSLAIGQYYFATLLGIGAVLMLVAIRPPPSRVRAAAPAAADRSRA